MASAVLVNEERRAEQEDDEEEEEVNWEALNPLLEATPRLFTSDISKLVDFLDLPDVELSSDEDSDEDCETPAPVMIPGLHAKVLLQQGLHLHCDKLLPPGTLPSQEALQRYEAILDAAARRILAARQAPLPVRQQRLQQRTAAQRSRHLQQRFSQQQRLPPQQGVQLQQRAAAHRTSPALSNSSSDGSTITLLDDLDGIPLVCLGDGERALVTTLVDALSHRRDNEGAQLELPKDPATDNSIEDSDKNCHIDDMERLNRICVWLFFCTHFEPSDDARDVLPKMLNDDDDEDIVDVTEVSMEMQGLLTSPHEIHDGTAPVTLREASAYWVVACGFLRGSMRGRDYDNNVKTFVLGLITAANMKYTDALTVINDAVPQAILSTSRSTVYRPSQDVLCIGVSAAQAHQVNAFLQFHMASSPEFRRACASSAALFIQTFLPVAQQFSAAIREGREVTLAQLIGNYTHSVVTQKVELKRPLEAPSLHLSQKKRREGAANLLLGVSGSSGLREDSDQEPSAFQPVVPRANTDDNKNAEEVKKEEQE